MRIGMGYDAHRLVVGRNLILGGVVIPFERGLVGHSDADVLTHAIIDALLGSVTLGDIGTLFPDTDERYKNVDSLLLLAEVRDLLVNNRYEIGNIDATIIAQAPKMQPYIEQMRKNLSIILEIDINQVSIKATTEEHMGYTGRGEGIAAQAIALVIKNETL